MLFEQNKLAYEDEFALVSNLLNSPAKAEAILNRFGIAEILDATRNELGLSQLAYSRLMAGIELGRRVAEEKQKYQLPEKICSTDNAIKFCEIHFCRLISDGKQEEFHIVTLNTKMHVTGSHRITIGTLDASLVHPREVFRPAIKDSASGILLVHNHPSGDATPSREDHAVTRRLEEAGQLLGIDVIDHVILAKGGSISIKAIG